MLVGGCEATCIGDAVLFKHALPVSSLVLALPAVSFKRLIAGAEALSRFLISEYVFCVLTIFSLDAPVPNRISVVDFIIQVNS